MYGKQKIKSTLDMEKIIFLGVSKDLSWKQIAEEEIFRTYRYTNEKIKSLFESNMRYKFRIIGRYSSCSEKKLDKDLSDTAFRVILTGKIPEPISQELSIREK